MMKKIEMMKGAKRIVDDCIKVRESENVLIITDTNMPFSIAEVMAMACKERGAETMIMIMSPPRIAGNDPPPPVAEAMQKAQVIFYTCSRSIFHSPCRLRATKAGARFFAFSDFTEDDMIRGAIEANFLETKVLVHKVADALARAKEARVTTPAGTDIYLDFRGRPEGIVRHDAICHHPGDDAVSIILEAAISPKVGTAHGIVVCDASATLLNPGAMQEPIRVVVKNGNATDISGGPQASRVADLLAAMNDPKVYNVAELGIGLNPKAKMTGAQTQDKGVYGTCHIGFGSNITWGGNIKAATHFDLIMFAPKIDLDGFTLLENYTFNL